MAARLQVLTISKRRLLSVAAITRPPPRSILSPRFNSAGYGKFSLKSPSATKDEKTDCYFKTADLIDDARKLVEENIANMVHNCKTIKQLKQIHLQMLINSMRSDDDNIDSSSSNYSFLADRLMLLSSDLDSFDYAYEVFMDLPSYPSLPSYNTLINLSVGKSDGIAILAYNEMRNNEDNSTSPDRYTLAFLLKSLAYFYQLESGETVHGQVIKLGFVSDAFVMSSLLDFFFVFVRVPHIRAVGKLFDEFPERDILSWNTMISGLVMRSLHHEALSVFDKMLLPGCGCKPNETTLINILSVFPRECLIEPGKWLDAYIKENKFELSLPLGNALISMFVSFGDLGNAKIVFKSMSKRCTTTWQSMMSGLLDEGFCNEALVLFDTMCCCLEEEEEEGGLKPNDVIFLNVLIAFCNDERLVGDGKRLFEAIHKMVHEFGVKPNRQHYEFMIWILSRAGWVEAAMMLVESFPGSASDYRMDWGCVLLSCQVHGNDLLLDSFIRKMYDMTSSSTPFLVTAFRSYIDFALCRKPNDDVNYGKSMVETLIRKLPDQKHVDKLNAYLDQQAKNIAFKEAYNQHYDHSSVHAQQTFLPHHHDDAFKLALQSLDRQLSGNSHDQIIEIEFRYFPNAYYNSKNLCTFHDTNNIKKKYVLA